MPRRIIALAVAALATTGTGIGAVVATAGSGATQAGCTTRFESHTGSNEATYGPTVKRDQDGDIIIHPGTPLAFAGAEEGSALAFENCVVLDPADAL